MSSESGGKERHEHTAPIGGTGTISTAANNIDTETGSTKNVMNRQGGGSEFPQTDQNRTGWASNVLSTGMFSGLEDQKHTDHIRATGGDTEDLSKHKPGGSAAPGGLTGVKSAWDQYVASSLPSLWLEIGRGWLSRGRTPLLKKVSVG
ncbi:hypothetical protein FQN54_004464 [Arachnomyces sp. PD_36]|nr:hypothetical protein FQN54_004464 [Arachnomyces sp. PD_36]